MSIAVVAPSSAKELAYSPVYVADSPDAAQHIDEAARLTAEKRYLDAVNELQPIIATMAEKLIATDANSYTNAAGWIEQHIRKQPLLLAAYQQAFGAIAQRELTLAAASLDLAAVAGVFDTYGLTQAGRQAGLTLAAMQLEAADAAGAFATLARWLTLHEPSPHAHELCAIASLMLDDQASVVLHRSALEKLNAAEAIEHVDAFASRVNPPHASRKQVSLPNKPLPLWRIALDQPGLSSSLAIESSVIMRRDSSDDWLAVLPTPADGDLLINTCYAVTQLDAISGRDRWTYRWQAPALGENETAGVQLAMQRGQSVKDRRGVAVLGDRVFAVLGEAFFWSLRREPNMKMTQLVCLDRATGEAIWQIEPDELDESLSQCYFIAAPVTDGRALYVAMRRHRTTGFLDSFVAALDPSDGSLIWRRHLSSLATRQRVNQTPPIEMLLRDGQVFLHDSAAIAAAIDARTGRMRWLRVLVNPQENLGRHTLLVSNNTQHVSPIVWSDAGLIIPPNNAAGVTHLIDPATGAVIRQLDSAAWRDTRVVIGGGDRVLGIGTFVRMFDGETLEPIWSHELGAEQDTQYGQPVMNRDAVIVAAHDGLRILDPQTGELQRTLPAPGCGNVVLREGELILATQHAVIGYLDWRDAAARLRDRIARAGSNPEAGLALAHLAVSADRPEAVIEGVDAAIESLRLQLGSPDYADNQQATFDELFAFTQSPKADRSWRPHVLQHLSALASTPKQQVAYHFLAADFAEAAGRFGEAVDHYQMLLADDELAIHMHRTDGVVRRVGDAAVVAIRKLVEAHGPGIYARYEAIANQQFAVLETSPNTNPQAWIELAQRYPMATTSSRALLAAAAQLRQVGRERQAIYELRRAYTRTTDSGLLAQISGELVTAYVEMGQSQRAAQWLRRVEREHPGLVPISNGQPKTIEGWLSELSASSGALTTRPSLRGPLQVAAVIEGIWVEPLLSDPLLRPRDRWLMRTATTLRMHVLDDPATPRWSTQLDAPDAQVLTFDDEMVTLWSPQQSQFWALDTVTGERAWAAIDVQEQLNEAGDVADRLRSRPLPQRQLDVLLNNQPVRMPVRPGVRPGGLPLELVEPQVFSVADASVVCMIDEVGRAVGIDRITGRVLWRRLTSLDRVGAYAIGDDLIAISGVHGDGTDALGGALLVLDAHTGDAMLPVIEQRHPMSWLGFSSNGLLVAVSPSAITAYHTTSGEVAWRFEQRNIQMAGQAWLGPQTMIARAAKNIDYMIDLDTGEVVQRLSAEVNTTRIESTAQGWMVFSGAGMVMLGRDGMTRWRDSITYDESRFMHGDLAQEAAVIAAGGLDTFTVWRIDPATGRLQHEDTFELTQHRATLGRTSVLANHLLLGFDSHSVLLTGSNDL